MKQVDKSHYNFSKYSHVDRWVSYYHQLYEIFDTKPRSVLEIGVGDRVIGNYLKSNTDISYTSIDIDPELTPDIMGDVLNLPFSNREFDVACAFEVLEHLPFEKFELALQELARVSQKKVLLSLPHFGPPVQLHIKFPFIKIRYSFKIPWTKKHIFDGEHYWEMGKKGYSPKKIRTTLLKYFRIEKEYVPFENQYHHFFILSHKK